MMNLWRGVTLAILAIIFCCSIQAQNQAGIAISDVYTDKARYAPNEEVHVFVVLRNHGASHGDSAFTVTLTFWHLGARIGNDVSKTVDVTGSQPVQVAIDWMPPNADFCGYFVEVRLIAKGGHVADRSQTAVDVSSDWKRFPRYGYLAHFSKAEGAVQREWIAALNKFHIDGLEFYDFENRHEQPLAGSVEHPAPFWKDIAGREVDRAIVDGFLASARQYNMTSMAYNTSYCAYADAFEDGSGVNLKWATWNTSAEPRTVQTAMALDLHGSEEWKTHRLVYMNQNSPEWQYYLFGQMANLFSVYHFDGWHIDTFGTRGAYAYGGAYVNFIEGFRPFIDHAHEYLNKRVVLNTVNTWGQDETARSDADFVYSELWEDHETYASILDAASQVHTANPQVGLVFAAYLQRAPNENDPPPAKEFNTPAVLLADAAIFASGASHIELGDGSRMLSSEYFPADTKFAVSYELSMQLRHYYDFLTAYENVLRYQVTPTAATVAVAGQPSSPYGVPNTIWTIARCKGERTIVHFINLKGSDDPHWRDVRADRPPAPLLTNLKVRVAVDSDIAAAGWASPDVDGGAYHPLALTSGNDHGQRYVEFVLPSLEYWDMVVLDHQTPAQ
ncbi:MAG: glycoside hydrolase family 66 protein [Terracidiphilus sp.]